MARANEKAEGYNGWKNYETWATALWIDNERETQDHAKLLEECARITAPHHDAVKSGIWSLDDGIKFVLAGALKKWVEEKLLPDLGATLAADLLSAAVSEIDWNEIAEHYIGAAREEREYQAKVSR